MLQLRVGIHLPSLRLPLAKGIALAGKLGADAVEIDARGQLRPSELSQTALRQMRKMLNDCRLRVCAVSFRTRRGYDVADELDARVDGTKAAMGMAAALGAAVVVNHVGEIPAEPKGNEWNLLVQVLTDLGRHGHHVGAFLAAQTGVISGEDLERLIAALPDGTMGVDLDPGQLVANGHSPVDAAERLGRHIMHVRATDAAREAGRSRGLEVPLGRGSVDFPAILGSLEERGYRGYFTIERETADPELEIGRAVKFLRSL
jgi:sugar phosphate isomerase/epimerase